MSVVQPTTWKHRLRACSRTRLRKQFGKGTFPQIGWQWRAYEGILRDLITVDARGLVTLEQVCSVAGLGGNPYPDGSFEYYVGEPVRANDYKGVGPFILTSLEMERAGSDGSARM